MELCSNPGCVDAATVKIDGEFGEFNVCPRHQQPADKIKAYLG